MNTNFMRVDSFLDPDSQTFSHILVDETTLQCAIVDPVLGFEQKSGKTDSVGADNLIDTITKNEWQLVYIIETHAHADHLSSASYIKKKLGGKTVMSQKITQVQKIFKQVYNSDEQVKTDASQFDILVEDSSILMLGNIEIKAMHVAGHTPADMAYIAKNTLNAAESLSVFIGDTIFAPDVGTARCDFPGGDEATLYQSIHKLFALPEDTVLYLCHDYPPNGRDYVSNVTVKKQLLENIHVNKTVSESEFVAMRKKRDATLAMPKLILPSIQVNIQAGD